MSQLSSVSSARSLHSDVSDSEFWVSLDSKPLIPDLKELSQPMLDGSTIALSAFSGFDDTRGFELSAELSKKTSKRSTPSCGSSLTTEAQIQRKFDKSLDIMRKAKNVEIANSTIMVKHSLTREFEDKLSALNRSFQYQKALQLRDIEYLKTELNQKNNELAKMQYLVGEQEVLISQLRILRTEKTPQLSASRTDSASKAMHHSESLADIQAEAELYKAQIESLRHLLDEERTESTSRHQAYKQLEEQFTALRSKSQEETTRLAAELAHLRDQSQNEKATLVGQLKSLKEEAMAESKASEEIQKRLQGVVASLQEELRTAKMVLTHPRLRSKIVTRLRDVESSLIEPEEKPVVVPSPSNPGVPRSARWTRRFRTAIRGNESISKAWNPKDHRLYMQSAELDRDLLDRSSSRRERYPSVPHIQPS